MDMLQSGLVSITFRQLSPAQVARRAHECNLQAIEWGGDIHAPHGNGAAAAKVAAITAEHGLKVSAYGSYYRVGVSPEQGLPFEAVLESAEALGAPDIRVWAGDRASAESNESYWNKVIEDARRISDMARARNITLSFEYHGNTLTDTRESTRRLFADVGGETAGIYWQPPNGMETDECVKGLSEVLPYLRSVHVFHWWPTHKERRPLGEGESRWMQFLEILARGRKNRYCLLEFVRDNDPDNLAADAETLNGWLKQINSAGNDL